MIAVQNLEQRAAELDKMGADYIAVHTGYDLQAKRCITFRKFTYC